MRMEILIIKSSSKELPNFNAILDRGSIRSGPRNGIGSTSKKNLEICSLVTESFFTLET